MTWGGHALWVTELDPATGGLMGHPRSTEFDTHPKGMHTCIMAWESGACPGAVDPKEEFEGDTFSSSYVEGPMLFKHGGYFVACGSYGNMNKDYTIRCCRSKDPAGPYVDKTGASCTAYSRKTKRYGASMLLGPEGGQLVPGHPHIWQEGERYFLGFDYRTHPLPSGDRMGFRELFWDASGWPTVWTPLEVTFDANDHPEMVGTPLRVALGNAGTSLSRAAFAAVSLTVSPSSSHPPATPRPPCNPNKKRALVCKDGSVRGSGGWSKCGRGLLKFLNRKYCPVGWAMCAGGKCLRAAGSCSGAVMHSARSCESDSGEKTPEPTLTPSDDDMCTGLTCRSDLCTRRKCGKSDLCAVVQRAARLGCFPRRSVSQKDICSALTTSKNAWTRNWCKTEAGCRLSRARRKWRCVAR